MKALGDRSVDPRALLLSWSPGLDLVAVAMETGILTLFRLNWQRVWLWKPSTKRSATKTNLIEWRPDGKAFVFVQDEKELHFMHVDQEGSNANMMGAGHGPSSMVNAGPMHSFKTSSEVRSLFWIALDEENGKQESEEDRLVQSNFAGLKGENTMRRLFERLPALDKAFSVNSSTVLNAPSVKSSRKLDAGKTYILVVATAEGKLCFHINGYLPLGNIDLTRLLNNKTLISVRSVALANDLTTLTVVCDVENSLGESELIVNVVKVSFLAQCQNQLHCLAKFYASINGLNAYLDESVHHMQEAFSEMVLELDAKLVNYRMKTSSEESSKSAMAADFLDLLVFGHTSVDLKAFLAHELTEKGLKKLEQSVETSYNNLLKLITNYLNSALNSVTFFIMHMLAKTKACSKYYKLGLDTSSLLLAQKQTMSFMAKCEELQTVICESAAKFEVFFKWLKAEMLRNEEKQVPEELSKVSQEDISSLVDIISSFDVSRDSEGNETQTSSLDQVGQYLKNKNLKTTMDSASNPWLSFLKDNPDLADLDLIVEVHEESSLLQEDQLYKEGLNKVFKGLDKDHTEEAATLGSVIVYSQPRHCASVPSIVRLRNADSKHTCGVIVFPPTNSKRSRVLSFRVANNNHIACCWLRVPEPLNAFDAQFYTGTELLLRLENNKEQQLETQYIWQLNLDDEQILSLIKPKRLDAAISIRAVEETTLELENLVPKEQAHRLEGMHQLSKFTCSGGRKVSAFVFASGRRVRIYDMEVDVEEEDDDELEDEEEAFDVAVPSSELNTSG